LGGSLTLIGTSTNLVVSGLLEAQGFKPIGLFELTPVGLPIFLVGIAYMYTVGYRLTPARAKPASDTPDASDVPYFSEVVVLPDSPLIGKSIENTPIVAELNLGILSLYRHKQSIPPLAETILQAGDILMVEGRREDMLKINQTAGIEINGTIEALDTYHKGQDTQIAEVIILPGSQLVGRNITGLRLRERYKIQILAITHQGETSYSKLGRRVLRLGDMMLIQVPKENLRLLEAERLFRVLDVMETPADSNGRAWLSLAVFTGALIFAALEVVPTAVAVLLGALLMFALNLISSDEAYRRVEWRVLILIGSMLAFGKAMETTGTADYLANHIIDFAGTGSQTVMLTVFFAWAVILTQLLSNQAAAAVTVPVAIKTAELLHWNPRPLTMMIVLAASCSFITPLEPACIIVYGAGKYRFLDFTKVGFLLTLIIYFITIMLVPLFWEF
jgi:di/tricarboxylate transporter